MKEESGAGEDMRRGPNLVSANRQRVRRMAENHASKSALAKERSLLNDSERFGLPSGPPLSSQDVRGRAEKGKQDRRIAGYDSGLQD
jgi:hypothetical protein